ncbi:MAG: ornithine cyclodeaminase family protein [Candidatus Brocadiia bacterium]
MASRKTLLLKSSDVQAVLNIRDAITAVDEVFRAYGEGRVQMPPKPYLDFGEGDLRCMPAYCEEVGLATVKNVNSHPNNRALPTVMATVTVFEPETGFALAVMDGTYLTAMRTGAAGGVAARHLARRDARVAGFVGAGRQAETQLAALKEVLPGLEEALFCDADRDRADALAERAASELGLKARACPLEEAVRGADVLTTTTPVREPLVRREWVQPGTHVNAIGADAPGKQELECDVLLDGVVVVDNWEQASHGGEINVAVGDGLMGREDICADIGQIVAGKKEGRTSADDITVFDSTGLAIQDLACAAHAYRQLTLRAESGPEVAAIDFMD